jgi:hypothetical protein
MRRRPRSTLAGQLFALQLAIIAVVLVAVAAVSLAQSAATFERVEGRRVAALAEQVASSPLVRASLAETETRTGLATLAQSLVTQTSVSSVSFAETDLDVRVSTTPPSRAPLCRSTRGWRRGELVGHPGDRRPRTSSRRFRSVNPDAVGAHLGSAMVAERALDVGAVAGHVLVPADLSRDRPPRRARRVVAAVQAHQAPDPGAGAGRDRRARRAPRGDAARHRRGCHRPGPPAPHHPGQRGGPAAARPA